jgi:hypothetical protein
MQVLREVALGSVYNCNIHSDIDFRLKTTGKINVICEFNCDTIHDMPLSTKRNRDLRR